MIETRKIKTPNGWAVVVFEIDENKSRRSATVVFSNSHIVTLEYFDEELNELEQKLIAGEIKAQRDGLDL